MALNVISGGIIIMIYLIMNRPHVGYYTVYPGLLPPKISIKHDAPFPYRVGAADIHSVLVADSQTNGSVCLCVFVLHVNGV